MAEDVLRRIPDEKVDLVGFSLGALVAQHLAIHRPERVRALVCVSSVCRRTSDERAGVEARLRTAMADPDASAAASIKRWFPAGTRAAPDAIDSIRRRLLANDVESFLHAYRVFAHGDADISGQLERIAAPTLAITGELDPGSTPDMTFRLAAAIPNARFEIVPGARHMLPIEDPAGLAAAIDTFVEAADPFKEHAHDRAH